MPRASQAAAARETKFFFGADARGASTAVFTNCTLGIVKPHIVLAGGCGPVLEAILKQDGLEVNGPRRALC